MNLHEIKANAPDGATHYDTLIFVGAVYYKYIDGRPYWYDRYGKQWIEARENLYRKSL